MSSVWILWVLDSGQLHWKDLDVTNKTRDNVIDKIWDNVIDKILDNFIDKLKICLQSKPYHGDLPKPCHGPAFGVQLWSKEHHWSLFG